MQTAANAIQKCAMGCSGALSALLAVAHGEIAPLPLIRAPC